MVALLLTVGLVLGAGAQAEARCYDVGTPQFRCDPIVFQALRQRVESRPAYPLPRRSRFELNSYTARPQVRRGGRIATATAAATSGRVRFLSCRVGRGFTEERKADERQTEND